MFEGARRHAVAVCAALGCLLAAYRGDAADTTEPYPLGVSDAEVYASYDGLGKAADEHVLGTELVLGAGVTKHFSVAANATFETALQPEGGAAAYGVGALGQVVDTDPVDLDIMLAFEIADLAELSVVPAVELNLDHGPDMGTFGAYLRAGVSLTRKLGAEGAGAPQPADGDDQLDDSDAELKAAVEINPGVYYTFAEGHQAFLEYDMAVGLREHDPDVDVGGLALGYNVVIVSAVELINQVRFDIPGSGETPTIGVGVGAIITPTVD